MRVSAMVAGAALLVAACGGGNKSGGSADTNKVAAPTTTAPTTTTTGATDTIQMVQTGATTYAFVPANLTIKVGDVVVFKGVSGAGHDVAFYEDSIPPGAKAVLDAQMKTGPQPLATDMIPDGSAVSISFAGAPTGTYKFFCIPHQAMGMKGTLTVQ
jgi:plastocyanin